MQGRKTNTIKYDNSLFYYISHAFKKKIQNCKKTKLNNFVMFEELSTSNNDVITLSQSLNNKIS